MKTFFAIFLALMILLTLQVSNAASTAPQNPEAKEFLNLVVMDDVGLIEGKGATKAAAFEAAAKDCFDKKKLAMSSLDQENEDLLLDIIDQCANIPY